VRVVFSEPALSLKGKALTQALSREKRERAFVGALSFAAAKR